MFKRILRLDGRKPHRENTLAYLQSQTVVGFEVTDEEYAAACVANFDPQHSGRRPDTSCIDATTAFVCGEITPATSLLDLDSLGAIAVLGIAVEAINQFDVFRDDVLARIAMIGHADRFEHGDWPGVRPLPNRASPWFESGGASETRPLAAMAMVVKDASLTNTEKAEMLKTWLLTGQEPFGYRQLAEQERLSMIEALERGKILLNEIHYGRLVTVVSTYYGALGVGYHLAPIVIANNPEFRFKDSEPHSKFTVAQFRLGYIDLSTALELLNELEAWARGIPLDDLSNRWGGSPTIIGSPMGESSRLSLDQVVQVVESCMT